MIIWSAHKHGIEDDDILHALHNPIQAGLHDEGFTMWLGPARSGELLEVGTIESEDGITVVIHAMSLEKKTR